jgi:diguanylate cyclase (GGDEF)-like protein
VLTLLAGARSGMTIVVPPGEFVLGRTTESHLALDDGSLSRQHARIVTVLDRHFIEDLASTNGTFVNGARVSEIVALEDGACVQLGRETLLRFSLRDAAEIAEQQRVYEAMVRDALTGLHNRHYLNERLESEFSFARRHGTALSVLFLDADHFKRVNDTHGHGAGDEVLRAIGGFLQRAMRTEDLVARFGGEEFIIALRGIERPGVLVAADRVRAGIEALSVEHQGVSLSVTVSIGVATLSPARPYASVEALLTAADNALSQAKELGRNRVVTD